MLFVKEVTTVNGRSIVLVAAAAFALTSCLTTSSQSGTYTRPEVPFPKAAPVEPEAPSAESDVSAEAIRVELHHFSVNESVGSMFGHPYDVEIRFTNTSDQEIRAFRGQLVFRDLFGDFILREPIRQYDPMPPDSELKWSGEVFQNDPSDVSARSLRATDLTVALEDVEIIWRE